MILRLGLAGLASALLLGCQTTPPEQQWTKSGATVDDVKRDLYWCTTLKRPTPSAQETPATRRDPVRAVDAECMEGRGYSRVSPKG